MKFSNCKFTFISPFQTFSERSALKYQRGISGNKGDYTFNLKVLIEI